MRTATPFVTCVSMSDRAPCATDAPIDGQTEIPLD